MTDCVVVFDVDGTIFDTKDGICRTLKEVFRQLCCEDIDDDMDKYIGPPIKDSLMNYKGFSEKLANEAVDIYRSLYVDRYIGFSSLYPDMKSVLENLYMNGYILGIATMKTYSQVEKLLDSFECKKYFSFVYAAKEDGSLSKCDMLLRIKSIVEKRGIDYYMVGDTIGDYLAAQNALYKFIAADYGYGNIDEVESIHIKKPKELGAFFGL